MADNIAMSRKQIGGEVPMVANEITDNCIYSGLFGSLDSARMAAVSEKIISLAEDRQSEIAIIDLGNVDAIDSAVSGHMVRLSNTLQLVGVKTIFCGIKGRLATTMGAAGIDLGHSYTVRDLKAALLLAFSMSNLKLIQVSE